ncbi:MAG: GGDEF domain-containing protein [Desulfuromonadaceae bacterium]|nr:GGDEF domain-containing protein [Desulfuromonadaceae bacterium]
MPLIPASVETYLIGSLSTSDLMAGLLLIGVGLLVFSLTIVRKLTKELPQGANRSRWSLLGIMILSFICGYLGFFTLNLGVSYTAPEMLVAVVFFFGAVFVLLVCLLAYRTTQELKRIYVLEHETVTDPLLGIFNRRFLDRRIQEEVLRAQRHRLDLSLLMVDIDNFKQVNDTWGHQAGDLVLQHLSQLLEMDLRQTDILARFGGEEFVILLPHTPEQDAFKLAEKLRRAVEQTPLHRIPELRVTISIGTSSLLPDGDDAHSLLERADKSMYRAKREGRNRVVSYHNNGFAEYGEDCP